jgi:hypothetical protein
MMSGTRANGIAAVGRVLIRITFIAIVLVSGLAILQVPTRAFAAANIDHSGFEMRVAFDRTLSSVSTRIGDDFVATVTDPGPFNSARICGHVESISQSQHFKGVTEMHLSFDYIRLRDSAAFPINAEIVRLYDVTSGEQLDAETLVESGRRRPQVLKRTGIGALAGGIFGMTSAGGFAQTSTTDVGAAIRPRVVGDRATAARGGKELILDQRVQMLLRVYLN